MSNFFTVGEVEKGCPVCDAETFWTVIWIDSVGDHNQISESYNDWDQATDLCELMNEAYELGQQFTANSDPEES